MRTLHAVVLVGGGSRRMGRPKQTLSLNNRTLPEIAVAAAEGSVERVVLAGDGPVPPALAGLTRLSDPPDVAGPLAGILSARRWRPGAAWIVVACDMPFVRPRAVEWLVSQRTREAWAILPRLTEERVEPLLAVYEPQMLDFLERRAAEGHLGFQDLAGLAHVCCPKPPAEIREAWTNVNTVEEFMNSTVIDV